MLENAVSALGVSWCYADGRAFELQSCITVVVSVALLSVLRSGS